MDKRSFTSEQLHYLRLLSRQYPTVQAATEAFVRVVDTIEPDPELMARYEERYQQFRKIYPACKDLFAELIKE